MTVIESIIKDLQGLPNAKLVEAAGMIHRLSEKAQQERAEALQGLYGGDIVKSCVSETGASSLNSPVRQLVRFVLLHRQI